MPAPHVGVLFLVVRLSMPGPRVGVLDVNRSFHLLLL